MKTAVAQTVAILMIALVVGACGSAASSQRAASPSISPAAGSSPTMGALVTYENALLGYRISLPAAYLRSPLSGFYGNGEGHDAYVQRTEAEERELCSREQAGGVQSLERESDVQVEVLRNPDGLTAAAFAGTPNRRIAFTSITTATVDGREAVKVSYDQSGDTSLYVIRANDRTYVLKPAIGLQPSKQAKGWLDQVAANFRLIPIPASSATPQAPRCTG